MLMAYPEILREKNGDTNGDLSRRNQLTEPLSGMS